MFEMKLVSLFTIAVCLGLVWGCATPVEVKQALISIDDGYEENLKLMKQYRELVRNMNTRHEYWYRYTRERLMLDTALKWITTNPGSTEGITEEDLAEVDREILGVELVALVNQIRLEGLPSRKDTDGNVVFESGRGTIDRIFYHLPVIIRAIEKKVETEYTAATQFDLTAFDDYRKNVTALRQINAMIQRYLDIDVTIGAEDIQEIAEALRELQ
jgi:hypothetical protein